MRVYIIVLLNKLGFDSTSYLIILLSEIEARRLAQLKK